MEMAGKSRKFFLYEGQQDYGAGVTAAGENE
jgi:hypothetical protein